MVSRWKKSIVDVTVGFTTGRETTFDFLVDPSNRPTWQSSLRRVEQIAAPGAVESGSHPGDTGSSWIDVTTVPGISPRMEVTGSDRPTAWTEIGTFGPVTAVLTLTFTERRDAGTDVRAEADIDVPTLLRPVVAVLGLLAPKALASDMRNAARILAERDTH